MGKRGPAAKPDEIKKLAGNPGGRPLNHDAPKFPSLQENDNPEIFDEEAKREWDRLLEYLRINGMATLVDRAALTMYCITWSRYVALVKELKKIEETRKDKRRYVDSGSKGGYVVCATLRALKMTEETLLTIGKQFGMTPASRTEVAKGKEADANPFSQLLH